MYNAPYATAAKLKIDRANVLINDIQKKVTEFVCQKPFDFEQVNSSEVGCFDIVLKIRKEIPEEIAVIVGDAVHNLRSSLDTLVFALANRNGANATQLRQVFYPVGQSKVEFIEKCMKLAPIIGNISSDAISSHEAFIGGRGEKIKRLGELSNTDKHRMLIPTVPKIEGPIRVGFESQEPFPDNFSSDFKFKLGELAIGKVPACDGDVLLTYADVKDDRFVVKYQPSYVVSLNFKGLVPGESVYSTLQEMKHSVVHAISQIIRAVGPR